MVLDDIRVKVLAGLCVVPASFPEAVACGVREPSSPSSPPSGSSEGLVELSSSSPNTTSAPLPVRRVPSSASKYNVVSSASSSSADGDDADSDAT